MIVMLCGKGKKIACSVESLGSSGEGVAVCEGLKIFVDGALPGERVEILITERKKSYARGRLLEVLQPSADRVAPVCPLFGTCGGCQIMHLSYPAQLLIKQRRVADALRKIGGFDHFTPEPCRPSPDSLAYRNKIQAPVRTVGGEPALGFYQRGSHEIVPVETCYIHCEGGDRLFQEITTLLKRSPLEPYDEKTGAGVLRHVLIRTSAYEKKSLAGLITTGREPQQVKAFAELLYRSLPEAAGVVGCVNTRKDNVILGSRFERLAGNETLIEEICGLKIRLSAASFFQVNLKQAEKIYREAVGFADLRRGSVVLDAYCGAGAMSLILAQTGAEVYGVESVPQAIKDGEHNAKINGVRNVRFVCDRVERWLPTFEADFDAIFLNPPRKGCDSIVLDTIGRVKPSKVVYISCDPATLARDLAILKGYGYVLVKAVPFDMFPQTSHVETVAAMRRLP